MTSPTQYLQQGAELLSKYLNPLGFKFRLKGEGSGSGGSFAYGEFVKKRGFFKSQLTIELHFRHALGIVIYKIGSMALTHEQYVELLGMKGENKYPGFSWNPVQTFEELLHDLRNLLTDFTEFDGKIFQDQAPKILAELSQKHLVDEQLEQKLYSGDSRILSEARDELKNGNFEKVLKLERQISNKNLLTKTERLMFEIASKKSR
tara:strand:+ start:2415 stop:3029 length:615 start_codon:yes stop_codon:yes gene_type:complete